METIDVDKRCKILKAVLMLRRCGNTYSSKEEQLQHGIFEYDFLGEKAFDEWIDSLREELRKTPEEREEESRRFCEELAEAEAMELYNETHWNDDYIPSSTAGDYGPSNPWDAPGMSIRDFI